jgi:type II secretory pathway pseudopilin PulG
MLLQKPSTLINKSSLAFSLVELSIVIVVISFIVAGITVGNSIVKQSMLRSVISDLGFYNNAVRSFYADYNQLPGDFSLASTTWSGGISNGNNDGQITSNVENFLAWQHLSLAKLIPGSFNGTAGATLGTNIPGSKVYGGGYLIQYYSGSWLYSQANINMLEFGKAFGSTTDVVHHAILTPVESYTIDTKIDDGLIANGKIIGYTGFDITGYSSTDSYCGTGTVPSRTYNVASNTVYCFLMNAIDISN